MIFRAKKSGIMPLFRWKSKIGERMTVLEFDAELLKPQPVSGENPIVMTITGTDAEGKSFTEIVTRKDMELTERLFPLDG